MREARLCLLIKPQYLMDLVIFMLLNIGSYLLFIFSNHTNGTDALDVAYSDVEAAFDFYIDNFNQGKPFLSMDIAKARYMVKG